jgi:hypothetical protein
MRDRRSRSRRRFGSTRVAGIALVVVAAAVVGVVLTMHSSPRHAMTAGQLHALEREEAASRNLAATWVSQQLSRSAVVACDKQMCSDLIAHGFPAANLHVLNATSSYPLSADVVIETATVRALLGSSFSANYAPEVLASCGSGAAAIYIRVIAPHGAAAYRQALASDLTQRRQVGSELLASSQISALPPAKAQLSSGQVDDRLLLDIVALASDVRIKVLGFSNIATRASPGMPLRYADLAESVPGVHLSPTAYAASLVRDLRKLKAQYQPLRTETITMGAMPVLQLEFGAPSPLGWLGPSNGAP